MTFYRPGTKTSIFLSIFPKKSFGLSYTESWIIILAECLYGLQTKQKLHTFRKFPYYSKSQDHTDEKSDDNVCTVWECYRAFIFVRDPLTRTLAGYLEMAHHHASTEHFRNWTYSVFPRDYTDECNAEAVRKSLD